MDYSIQLSRKAQKQLSALPKAIQERLQVKIGALATEPRPPGTVALQGIKGLLRLRVGDYRIIYQVDDDILIVLVVEVGHRREVYKRM